MCLFVIKINCCDDIDWIHAVGSITEQFLCEKASDWSVMDASGRGSAVGILARLRATGADWGLDTKIILF